MRDQNISREDVLRDFSVEFDYSKDILLKYLSQMQQSY